MKLKEYQSKRNFKQTREPKGRVTSKGQGGLKFVVQHHDATREHYDFRLEIQGVLVSWAIPKQPVAKLDVKRLAIRTEDHPMEYLNFEGTIPQGNYGAGTVMVWDTGTYHLPTSNNRNVTENSVTKQLERGTVKIYLEGEKLKGLYTLVRLKNKKAEDKEHWLFFKNDDRFAGKRIQNTNRSAISGQTLKEIEDGLSDAWEDNEAQQAIDIGQLDEANDSKMPTRLKPMLATLTGEPFDNDDWLFEIKYDGYRALAFIHDGEVHLKSRSGKSFNDTYKKIATELSEYSHDVVLDGEIVVENREGKHSFQKLQQYEKKPEGHLVYIVFDLLYYNGSNIQQVPLIKRKEILKEVMPAGKHLRYCDHVEAKGKQFFELARREGLEGIIAKRKQSTYKSAKRSDDWLKIKGHHGQEVIIGGYTKPQGSRKHFGSLLMGVKQGEQLVYAGKVGTGYTDDQLEDIYGQLSKLERKTTPFDRNEESQKDVTYVTPKLVAQVKFTEWTDDGMMRHPVFLGLRTDKKADKVIKEQPLKRSLVEIQDSTEELQFTNRDKLYFPDAGYTKQDMITYYEQISDYLLPHLKDRPQSLRRNPNGIDDEGFFQKNVAGQVPSWVDTVRLKSSSKDEDITYMLCNNKETLLFMANWGCIELNPWTSRVGTIIYPDYIVFDLDPEDVPFHQIKEVAFVLKELLESIKAPAGIKTSGGRGLHVYIPINNKYTYKQTRQFAQLLGMRLREKLPKLVSLERMPAKRQKQVYIDYLQNAKGKTMASVYSARPKTGAPVSTPITWNELDKLNDPKEFHIKNMPQRLKETGDLWADLRQKPYAMEKHLDKMGK